MQKKNYQYIHLFRFTPVAILAQLQMRWFETYELPQRMLKVSKLWDIDEFPQLNTFIQMFFLLGYKFVRPLFTFRRFLFKYIHWKFYNAQINTNIIDNK